jgi:anti-sigma regulatory factor (Ser/Thr protein kinase)
MVQMGQGRIFTNVTTLDLGRIRRYVLESAVAGGGDPPAVDELVLAVNEAVVNIVHHAYRDEPGEVELSVSCSEGVILVILLDHGPPFDPTTMLSPDTTLPLDKRPFGGMGIHFMREFCDELRYRRDSDGRNELTLLKRFGPQLKGSP